jgi:hypothetical protein
MSFVSALKKSLIATLYITVLSNAQASNKVLKLGDTIHCTPDVISFISANSNEAHTLPNKPFYIFIMPEVYKDKFADADKRYSLSATMIKSDFRGLIYTTKSANFTPGLNIYESGNFSGWFTVNEMNYGGRLEFSRYDGVITYKQSMYGFDYFMKRFPKYDYSSLLKNPPSLYIEKGTCDRISSKKY